MRIAILSNVTVEVLSGMLGKEHTLWLPAGYGAWMETALEPPEELKAFGPEAIYILLDRHFKGARDWTASDVASATAALKATFGNVPVVVPDIAALAADFGDAFYEPKMWQLARMPFSLLGLGELRKLFGVKKVLALDLDQTLWDGTIGEDGAAGVAPKVEFQRQVKAAKERGAVLAIISRNNPEDVEEIWNDPRMVLRKEDFVAFAINWEDKAANIAKIAGKLNLGLESFVFVDDNPAERVQMRAIRPEVCTAAFPPDLSVYFPEREMTAEDAARTGQYQAEAERRSFAAGLSVADYLKGLEIRTDIHLILEAEIARVAQLSQKTNQFNVCTNRYTSEDIAHFAADPEHFIFTLHAADRFGDQGLVAFVHVAPITTSTYAILDWVMSCRVMNRRIEYAVEREVERQLRERGVTRLTAVWRRTAKNAPVKDLFESFGFTLVSASEDMKTYDKLI